MLVLVFMLWMFSCVSSLDAPQMEVLIAQESALLSVPQGSEDGVGVCLGNLEINQIERRVDDVTGCRMQSGSVMHFLAGGISQQIFSVT